MIAWKGGKLLQEEPAEVLIKNTELSRLKKISKVDKTLFTSLFSSMSYLARTLPSNAFSTYAVT